MRWYNRMLSQLTITVPQNTMTAFTNAISGAPRSAYCSQTVGT